MAVTAQRMQIEESFRDLKSQRFGLEFSVNRSTQKNRLCVLLLVACLASFVLRYDWQSGQGDAAGIPVPEQHAPFASGGRRFVLQRCLAAIREYEFELSHTSIEGLSSVKGLHIWGIADLKQLDRACRLCRLRWIADIHAKSLRRVVPRPSVNT